MKVRATLTVVQEYEPILHNYPKLTDESDFNAVRRIDTELALDDPLSFVESSNVVEQKVNIIKLED